MINKLVLKRFGLLALLLCPTIASANVAILKDIRLNHLKHGLQYVIDVSSMVPVTDHTYHRPYRKVYSFYHVLSKIHLKQHFGINQYVSAIKIQHGKSRVSVGFHLTKPYSVESTYWAPSKGHDFRYVITIKTSSVNVAPHESNDKVTFNRNQALASVDKAIGPQVHDFIQHHLNALNKSKGTKQSYSQLYQTKTNKHSVKHYIDQALQHPYSYQSPKKVVTKTEAKPVAKQHAASKTSAKPVLSKDTPDDKATQVDLPIVSSNHSAKRFSSKIIVVIDPGHGGKDPGATGPRGHHEKRVVLEIAKKLQKEIDSYRGFKAVLTRGDDRYLTLRYRLLLARKYHGDMFVAIHADAFINSSAHGASVFALSQRGATSEAARWLAERENQSELMGGVNLSNKDRTLRSVLIDLSQTATIGASLKLGSGIITQLKPIVPLHAGHVEQAAFVVLKSPDIPSLLIETGFISNPTEEQLLIRHSHQQRLAKAIARGIVNYFKQHPPRGSWLAKQTHTYYVVKSGDTISNIAREYNLSIQQFVDMNHLNHSNIYVGQRLKVS